MTRKRKMTVLQVEVQREMDRKALVVYLQPSWRQVALSFTGQCQALFFTAGSILAFVQPIIAQSSLVLLQGLRP